MGAAGGQATRAEPCATAEAAEFEAGTPKPKQPPVVTRPKIEKTRLALFVKKFDPS